MKKKKIVITFNAPVVLTMVAICFVATLLGYLLGRDIVRTYFMTYRSSWLSPFTYLRLFTHIFGHADWNHLIGNASYLLLLGPILEEKYSSSTLAAAIGITALVTGLVNCIFFPQVALYGASGVVFAFILLASFTSFKKGEIPLTFILVAIFFIGQQVMQGIILTDNISNTAHIVGGLVGAVLGYVLNGRYRGSR